MAEFQEVMKQYNRLCKEFRSGLHAKYCNECPVSSVKNGKDSTCTEVMRGEPEWFEKTVMDWAEKQPEPRYPTWDEWWKREFPAADNAISPCTFGIRERFACFGQGCKTCRAQPIPADIAEKLGIKPIGGDSE